MTSDTRVAEPLPIPVIDLSLPTSELLPALHAACSGVGFFYLVNHGVPAELTAATFALSRRFFSLPLSRKLRYQVNRQNRGYTPFRDELLSPDTQRGGDTKEGWYEGVDRQEEQGKLYGRNMRVDDDDVPGWSDGLHRYMQACRAVGMRLVDLLWRALHGGQDDGSSWSHRSGCFDEPMLTLRLLHYEAQTSDESQGVFACGEHCDYGFCTLLAVDDEPGLQIHTRQSGWLDVPALPAAFVVNIGDMLQRWSNGRYRSTLHRVVNRSGRERYSLPFFFEPNHDCVVECLPSCCDAEHPPQWPAVTSGLYLQQRYAATQSAYKLAEA